MRPKGSLAELELECLRVLWEHPGASVAQVRSGLSRPLAYTTVMTVLDRMSGKGLVDRQKNGRAYLYTALLDQESARRTAVSRLASRFFDSDPAALARYALRLRGDDLAPVPLPVPRPRRPATRKTTPPVVRSYIDDSLL